MHHRLEPSAGLEFIHPAQSPKDLLAYLLTLADAMDDLEILVEQSSEEQQALVQKAAVAARGSKKHNALAATLNLEEVEVEEARCSLPFFFLVVQRKSMMEANIHGKSFLRIG